MDVVPGDGEPRPGDSGEARERGGKGMSKQFGADFIRAMEDFVPDADPLHLFTLGIVGKVPITCAFNSGASSCQAPIPHVAGRRKPLQDTLQYEMLLRREIRKDQTALVAEGRWYGILLHGSILNSPHHKCGQG